jgi:hypothetical protein
MQPTKPDHDYLTHYFDIARYQWLFALSIGVFLARFLLHIRHEWLKSEYVQLRAIRFAGTSPRLVHFSSDNGKDRVSVTLEDMPASFLKLRLNTETSA